MATQKCPKCRSNRVRLGYRPTPSWMKLLFRYYLLCDQCNWEFAGFAIPGTIRSRTRSNSTKKYSENNGFNEVKTDIRTEILLTAEKVEKSDLAQKPEKKAKVKRKVKTKLL